MPLNISTSTTKYPFRVKPLEWETRGPGSFMVADKLKPHRLLLRLGGRLGASQNAAHIVGYALVRRPLYWPGTS
jgi:hypothetical protein